MDEPKKSRFDLSQIGEADKHNLASTFLDAIKEYYDDPENLKKFEAWKKEREQVKQSEKKQAKRRASD